MEKILHHSIQLRCDTHQAFEMFTANERLESWLPELADVEPVVGGKYELFFEPDERENNSTIGCKVTAVEGDKFIAFEWKGPVQYKHFMNNADPLTHVVVFFLQNGKRTGPGTEVHVIHSGWRNSAEWEEASQYFKLNWTRALEALAKIINKS